VFNKIDSIDDATVLQLRGIEPAALFVSAHTGEGVDALLERIDSELPRPTIELSVIIPFDRGELVARMHNEAIVRSTDYDERGTLMSVVVDDHLAADLQNFVVAA
jgi:GTP-binding protein HflX